MNKILLSICIPTYNRASVLEKTLENLFSNPEFDFERIEVIVSDNCSMDNTEEIVKKFNAVKYFKNQINIKDENFSLALSYATGRYVRLFNDTLKFRPNSLKFIIDTIDSNTDENKLLFFYKNQFNNFNCSKIIKNKSELVNELSFLTTWIANFGVWKNDFDKIIDKNRFASYQFAQVDWTYRLLENNKQIKVYFGDFFDVFDVSKKGGYNVFDVFINKYLYIIKNNKLSFFIYQKEKYRLFRHFVYSWMVTLLIKRKDDYSFDTSKSFNIILRKYWYAPYFYMFLVLFWFKKIKK